MNWDRGMGPAVWNAAGRGSSLGGIVFWVAVVVLAVVAGVLVYKTLTRDRGATQAEACEDVAVIDERLATGEISPENHQRTKDALCE